MLILAMVVVELFTSQGCSSCPPADALLAVLDKDPDVLVLSEHVDYWNHLGWRDPFSSSAHSARQQAYARRFGQDGPYTPQMVVDGQVQFVGSDARRARAAIAAAGAVTGRARVTVRREGEVAFVEAPALGVGSKAELWVGILRPEGEAEVARGENAGRRLRHVGIVRSLVKGGVVTRERGASYRVVAGAGERVVAFLPLSCRWGWVGAICFSDLVRVVARLGYCFGLGSLYWGFCPPCPRWSWVWAWVEGGLGDLVLDLCGW